MTPYRKARLILDNAEGQIRALRLPSNDPVMAALRQVQQAVQSGIAKGK